MSGEAFAASSREELPAQSHRLHEDGLWGCGQGHGCLSHLPQQTRPERAHLPTPLGKKCIQQTSIFPISPFFWGLTPCGKGWWEALCSAQCSWALPQLPMRCCWAWAPFNLPTPASPSLRLSSTLQRRAKSQLIDSHVPSAPLTHCAGWFLSPAIPHPLWWIVSASCTELVTCWWLPTQPFSTDRQHREHLLCHHGLSAALDGTRSWHLTTGHSIIPCQPEPALLQPGQGIWWETQHSSRGAHKDIVIKSSYCLRDRNNPVFLLFQLAVWKSLCETDQICNYNTMEKIAGMSHRVFNSWRPMTIAYFCWVYSCKNSNES